MHDSVNPANPTKIAHAAPVAINRMFTTQVSASAARGTGAGDFDHRLYEPERGRTREQPTEKPNKWNKYFGVRT